MSSRYALYKLGYSYDTMAINNKLQWFISLLILNIALVRIVICNLVTRRWNS